MLQFVRQIPVQVFIQKALSSRQGFLFHISAGFCHDVDPLSGMSVNLKVVDEWLGELKARIEKSPFESSSSSLNDVLVQLLTFSKIQLAKMAESSGARLVSLSFQEVRGMHLFWDEGLSGSKIYFKSRHYLETFTKDGRFDLVQVSITRPHLLGSDCDYHVEELRVLKRVSQGDVGNLTRELSVLLGHRYSSGAQVEQVSIEFLGAGYKLLLP